MVKSLEGLDEPKGLGEEFCLLEQIFIDMVVIMDILGTGMPEARAAASSDCMICVVQRHRRKPSGLCKWYFS